MLTSHKKNEDRRRAIKGYYAADHLSKNEFERFIYKSMGYEKKNKGRDKGNSHTKKLSKKTNRDEEDQKRDGKEEVYECSKLNIYPLLKNGKKKEAELYKLLTKMIRSCFLDEKNKKVEYLIADELINFSKKNIENEKEPILEKVSFKDKKLQRIWYQMLKGGSFYGKNIPSILDMVKISQGNKICVEKASFSVLKLFFDENTALKIIAVREHDKKKLKDIVTNSKTDFRNMLSLSHKKHKKIPSSVVCTDTTSKISIKRPLNF